ncbi:hypothetical protein BHM03_00035174 [Ensete ventricosum]|nr:hypothetical protein BHM03_00035174 [Ensete ventricosum]
MGGGSRTSDHLPPGILLSHSFVLHHPLRDRFVSFLDLDFAAELADEGETASTSSSTSDYHPDDSPLSASSGITESITDSASEEESAARDNRRWCKAYFDVLQSYRNSAQRAGLLRDAKDLILRHVCLRFFLFAFFSLILSELCALIGWLVLISVRHKPGDWIEEAGGTTAGDYEIPEAITLLLVGPRGSGKSTLVNRITRVFDDDLSAPDRAQVSREHSSFRNFSIVSL